MYTSIRLFIFLCLMGCAIGISAQSLQGRVVHAVTGEPIFGAIVAFPNQGIGVSTDYDGRFTLKPKSLPDSLEIANIGFITQRLACTSMDLFIDVKLQPDGQSMGVIEVRENGIFSKQKASPLSMETMSTRAIKEVPAGNFYEGLSALKGVDMASASLAFRVINTRGFNSTSPVRVLQLIDGVDNQSPGLNFSLGNFLGAPDLDLKSVDIIQGASSAYFGPGAFNGVISMETKNPFLTPGLSVNMKVGERNLMEPSFRWADVIKNEKGEDVVAYKLNLLYLTAEDWHADNTQPIYGASEGIANPGRFDAVNVYGDEYYGGFNYSTTAPFSTSYRGLGTYYRTGYAESELVDYRTKNLKFSAAFHARLRPEDGAQSPEFIMQTNVGNGTTVYQGDNRFRLQDIFFMQNRLELRKKDDFFIRVYATHENAGKSYDPYFTAQKLRDEARSQEQWMSVYNKYWKERIIPRMNALAYPELVLNPIWWDSIGPVEDPLFQQYYLPYDTIAQQSWLNTYHDSLMAWHQSVEHWTNTGNAGIVGIDTLGFYAPGTPQFQEAFDRITAAKNNEGEGGTRFYDRSSLYNLQAEKRWRTDWLSDLRIGMSARLYAPLSDGTIFMDTLRAEISNGDTLQVRDRIYNWQAGAYIGAEKKLLEDELTLSATIRADRNQNFATVFSPAFSAIWNPANQHYLRFSVSSALRNPALTDQYLNLNVGPAILRGNLDGADSLITIQSFQKWRDSQDPDDLRYFNINPIRPEQARTIELGYRGSFREKWFVDAGVYTTYYQDFIGYKIGLTTEFDALGLANLSSIRVYRYAANSDNTVVTQGANLGVNYYYHDGHAIGVNYSFNQLNKTDKDDPIIPAFNTPKHKGNISLSGSMLPVRDTKNRWGYGLNAKWVDAYFWEGSPQFTGPVPAFFLMDAQLNFLWERWNTTFKAGCSNLLNNNHIEAYGGPYIGRLAYFSISYEWLKK